jgi:hypothetical protein
VRRGRVLDGSRVREITGLEEPSLPEDTVWLPPIEPGAALVMSEHKFKPGGVDLRWISAILSRNSVVEESGVAAAALDHPANGPAWLANKLHPYGVPLEPGKSFSADLSPGRGKHARAMHFTSTTDRTE